MSRSHISQEAATPDPVVTASGSETQGSAPAHHIHFQDTKQGLLPSFSRALLLNVVGLLVVLGLVLFIAIAWQAVLITDRAARLDISESLKQVSGRVQQLIHATEMTAQSVERVVRFSEVNGHNLQPMLESSLAAFEQRPELSYIGIVVPNTGEYGNVERESTGSVMLWQFPEVRRANPVQHASSVVQTFMLTDHGFVKYNTYPTNGYDPRTRPFYQAAVRGPDDGTWMPAYEWRVYSQQQGSLWGISYVKAIRNQAGKLLAVIDADFDIPALNRFLAPLVAEYRTQIHVVELGEVPRLIAASDIGQAPLPISAELASIISFPGKVFVDRVSLDGERRWVAAQRLQLKGGVSWMVITSRAAPLIDAPLRHQLLQVLAMGAVIAIGLVLVSLRLARRFGRPVTELEQRVTRIGRQQEEDATSQMTNASQGFRETQLLSKALNRMQVAMREQALAQQQQAASIRLKSAIFDSSSAAIFSLDSALGVLELNAAAEQMFGLSRETAIGQSIDEMVFAPDGPVDWDLILVTEEVLSRQFVGSHGPFDAELRQVGLTQEGRNIHILVLNDVTERKQYEERIHALAMYDVLTGLPNRNLMRDRIVDGIVHAQTVDGLVALLYLDLGRFKVVNEAYGHLFGNNVLRAVGEQLLQFVREGDTVARLSGDEFLVLLADVLHPEEVESVVRRIIERFHTPVVVQGREIHLSVSIGVSIFPQDGESADALIDRADMAMYRSKELGHNMYQFFTREMGQATQRRVDIELKLRSAVANGELELVYQPKVSLEHGHITGCEALLRWHHPELGLVSPSHFIPVAEDSGLIVPIGDWVLRTACLQARAWMDAGLVPVCVAVNISVRQFLQQDVVAWVANTLQEAGLPPQWLELEITESLIAQDIEKVTDTINQLKDIGIRLSIDDFGTGYSSLNYLKRFRVDTLKIDQSFIRNMLTEKEDSAIVLAVIALAHSLEFKVIAEGVEGEQHCSFLHSNHCDEIQGYYFSKPVTVSEFEHMLRESKRLSLPA